MKISDRESKVEIGRCKDKMVVEKTTQIKWHWPNLTISEAWSGLVNKNISLKLQFIIIIIIIYFENVHFLHAKLGLDVCPYEVPPHIPVYCQFRLQTKHFHVIIHTFSPSLPVPTPTPHPCHLHISTGRHPVTQSSTLLCSRCPLHYPREFEQWLFSVSSPKFCKFTTKKNHVLVTPLISIKPN